MFVEIAGSVLGSVPEGGGPSTGPTDDDQTSPSKEIFNFSSQIATFGSAVDEASSRDPESLKENKATKNFRRLGIFRIIPNDARCETTKVSNDEP